MSIKCGSCGNETPKGNFCVRCGRWQDRSGLKCWKCKCVIDEGESDNRIYLSNPPRFSHKVCPILEPFAEKASTFRIPSRDRGVPKELLYSHGADGTCETDDCGTKPCECKRWASTDLEYLTSTDGRHHPDCPKLNDTDLSLLVIDLGTSCVVKVEKGHLGYVEMEEGRRYVSMAGHQSQVFDWSFPELRAAIDALAGEKPFPCITFNDAETLPYALCLTENGTPDLHFGRVDYDALSQLAGKPLEIYEPKQGEWKELWSFGAPVGRNSWQHTCTVWRFTRRGK